MRARGVGRAAWAVLVVAALAAACGGSGGGNATPTATPGIKVIRGAGAQKVPSPSPSTEPQQHRIQAGEWDFNFKVVSNSCGSDPPVGKLFNYAYYLDSLAAKPDGYIYEGQPIRITHLGGNYVGNTVFTWPTLSFDYPIDGGNAHVDATFNSDTTGVGGLSEAYKLQGGDTCTVFLRDEGG